MMPLARNKLRIARQLDRLGVNAVGLELQRRLLAPYLRILYYHDVSPELAGEFRSQLEFYAAHFALATREDVDALLEGGRWRHRRPGIVLTFDDGLRSHAETVAPLLERYGFEGWFFVPIGLLELPPHRQPEAAAAGLVLHDHDTTRDPRVFMTLDELRAIGCRHLVGCHTVHHTRLGTALTDEQLREEVLGAKTRLEHLTGNPVDSFAWVGGEESTYSAAAARLARSSFRYVFTTNTAAVRRGGSLRCLDRTHVEASFPLALVRFQLSGLMDLYYQQKRRRLEPLLQAAC